MSKSVCYQNVMTTEKTMSYYVLAAVDGRGKPWRNVLSTGDRAYAEATVEQFKEAGVPVRLDEQPLVVKRARRG